jgi:hypothetical protein
MSQFASIRKDIKQAIDRTPLTWGDFSFGCADQVVAFVRQSGADLQEGLETMLQEHIKLFGELSTCRDLKEEETKLEKVRETLKDPDLPHADRVSNEAYEKAHLDIIARGPIPKDLPQLASVAQTIRGLEEILDPPAEKAFWTLEKNQEMERLFAKAHIVDLTSSWARVKKILEEHGVADHEQFRILTALPVTDSDRVEIVCDILKI